MCLWFTLRKEKMSFLRVFFGILFKIIVKICNAIMLLRMGSFLLCTEPVTMANTANIS